MERLVFLSLMFVASALAAQIDPRGARPVEPATRSEKCATEKEWPFCTSDNWGPKCPSGCRIQGLMDKDDHDLLKKIEKIRSLLDQNRDNNHNAESNSKKTYDILRERLIVDAGHDNNYFDLAQNLRQRITDMKIRIDRQLSVLAALKDRVKDQVVEMQRLEVDIDIKLRSCKGSCQSYSEYSVDKDSYVELDKQINQLDAQSGQRIESVGSLSVMKSRLLKDSNVETLHKSKDTTVAAQQREDMFPDVNTVQLILEEEGSSSSPATISKDPGTSFSSSTSSSSSISSSSSASTSTSTSSSSSSTLSKSITELGGSDFSSLGGVSTSHITCTKSTRTTTVHTKDGPVEKTEEVIEGGPECQSLTDLSTGGISSVVPSLSHTSSSSSSSSSSFSTMTKTVHTSDTKGSLFGDTKTGFEDLFGSDFGSFGTNAADDDLPDIDARSLTSTHTERHTDYTGKVCIRLKQQNQDGRQPYSQSQTYMKQHCRGTSGVALCSDDDWVSKCPSGCRLQGLILQLESKVERRLRMVCKTAKMYEDMSEKSMTVTTRIYNYNRRVIVNRYMSELKFVENAEGLTRNLTLLRKRSSQLSLQLEELRGNVQKQLEDLYRAEVDIDMKLRACSGSCRSLSPFSVDHLGYQSLQADMEQMDKQTKKSATPPEDVPHVKLQPVDVGPEPSAEYKTIPTVQRELLTQFEDIGQNQVVLEELLEAVDPAELE